MSNKKQELLLPKVPVEGQKDKLDQFNSKIKADLATALSSKPKVFYLFEKLPRSFGKQEEKDLGYLEWAGYTVINKSINLIFKEYHTFFGELIDAQANIDLARNSGARLNEEMEDLVSTYPQLNIPTISVNDLDEFAYQKVYLELLKSADIFAFRRTKDGEILCTEALAFAQEQGIFTMDLTEIVDLVAEWNTSAKNTTSISSSIFHIINQKNLIYLTFFSQRLNPKRTFHHLKYPLINPPIISRFSFHQ